MKNLLKLGTDILLILFFIIILLVPILVALNLDPKLYQKNHSNVAGITSKEDKGAFGIDTSKMNNSNGTRLGTTAEQVSESKYIFNFVLTKGSKFHEEIVLGKIFNNTTSDLDLLVTTYEKQTGSLNDLDLNLNHLNSQEELKKTVTSSLEIQNDNKPLILDIKSNSSINYKREFEIHINLINTSVSF